MNYSVREGKEAVFERAFQQVRQALEQAEGHNRSKLYKDTSDPKEYLILSEWDDEKAFQSFVQSEAFARVTQWGKEQILSRRPSHQTYGT